jgi:cysteine desulfurase/selenocysteine lyase
MDLAARRREFPALDVPVQGHRLAYLDSAATTLTPKPVIDAVASAMSTLGNPGRGVHAMAEAATEAIFDARELVAGALIAWRGTAWASVPGGAHSPETEEIIFTSGTTAAVNLVADTWGMKRVGQGDVVIASEAEHHSNLLPWQRLCERNGAKLELARVDDRGRFDLDAFRAQLKQHGERVKLVAVAHVSNVLGTIAPIADIAFWARSVGAKVFVDGAQAMAHLDVDLDKLNCDFYAFSAHKLYGPPGIGVLFARSGAFHRVGPWQVGGGMVGTVERDASSFHEGTSRYEAGTPNLPAIVGLHAALVWAREALLASMTGASSLRDDEALVHEALCETIRDAGARILGAPQLGVVSFAWDFHPHDIATIANGEGVALRSGHHCAQLIHKRFGVDASTRASVGCYSSLEDVEQLGRALAKVRSVLGKR